MALFNAPVNLLLKRIEGIEAPAADEVDNLDFVSFVDDRGIECRAFEDMKIELDRDPATVDIEMRQKRTHCHRPGNIGWITIELNRHGRSGRSGSSGRSGRCDIRSNHPPYQTCPTDLTFATSVRQQSGEVKARHASMAVRPPI
jgi:hypothetical protein